MLSKVQILRWVLFASAKGDGRIVVAAAACTKVENNEKRNTQLNGVCFVVT